MQLSATTSALVADIEGLVAGLQGKMLRKTDLVHGDMNISQVLEQDLANVHVAVNEVGFAQHLALQTGYQAFNIGYQRGCSGRQLHEGAAMRVLEAKNYVHEGLTP